MLCGNRCEPSGSGSCEPPEQKSDWVLAAGTHYSTEFGCRIRIDLTTSPGLNFAFDVICACYRRGPLCPKPLKKHRRRNPSPTASTHWIGKPPLIPFLSAAMR